MDNRIIAGKYEILDTLFSNEIQAVYSAKKAGVENSANLIVNEFRNTDTIYGMKDNFSKEKCGCIRNIIDTFYEDFCFYVVCNICPGPDLEAFLSDNNLRLTEKMYLTESLLTQLLEIEKLSPFIVYSLCSPENLFVTGKRHICLNCNLKFTPDVMSVSRNDVCSRVAEIMCAIFSNTVTTDLNYAKDNMPPALFPLVSNCLAGKYESIEKLYEDFKGLLLYSVFMGSGSVGSQIEKNYKRAKAKRKLLPLRRLAAAVIVLLIASGVWMLLKDLDIATLKSNKAIASNSKPSALFSASREQVYTGELVIFTNQSSDQDSNDSIASNLWVITRDSVPVFDSSKPNITYVFPEEGKYEVSLMVADSRGESSEPYKAYVSVVTMPDFTAADGTGGAEAAPDNEEYK